MGRTYPGNCYGKEVVRKQIYDYVKRAPRDGYGVILAGPEPEVELAEVERSGWPFEQLVAVDKVAHPALYNITRTAPGARVIHADAAEAITSLDKVSWFNGDFCGFSRSVLRSVAACTTRLLAGGFISLTWARGRGSLGIARRIGDSPLDGLDTLVRTTAADNGIKLRIDNYWQYNRPGGMPMGVGVWIL